jgi:hypothetical protein
MKLESVTCEPGVHIPQTIDLAFARGLDLLDNGIVRVTPQPGRDGRAEPYFVRGWSIARPLPVPQQQPKGK